MYVNGPDVSLYESILVLESLELEDQNTQVVQHSYRKVVKKGAKQIEDHNIQVKFYDPELAAFLGSEK